jgi:hypothetical protein
MKKPEFLDPRTMTLLIALAIGLAIAVHPVFLVIGFIITIAVLIEAVLNGVGEHAHRAKPAHRHP